jgi:hypothetical protein
LTGYAVAFNWRHGQLFQNRYKSILKAVQEDIERKYQLEAAGYSFDGLVGHVARQLELEPKDVIIN